MIQLVAENLACVRGGRRVFDGMNFQFSGGEAVAITGANGAGKTSLLRLVAGLLPPEAGSVSLKGAGEDISSSVQLIAHLDGLKGALTVRENLVFSCELLGGSNGNVESALHTMNLAALAEIPARMLSAGQKRRLALARLIVTKRPLWLLDEPTSALDAESQNTLFQIIDTHTGTGGLALIATHAALPLKNLREFRIGGVAQ